MSIIQTRNLTVSYGRKIVLDALNLSVLEGKISILIGSNGSGKSTLLRAAARLLSPSSGSVFLNSIDIRKLSSKAVARQLTMLPQSCYVPEGITVFQLVKQGRYPYRTLFQQWTQEDENAVYGALKATNMVNLSDTLVEKLSGGQRQRALIAMILAQDTDILMLDEPITYLDIAYQIDILDLLFSLNRKKQNTIIMVLHDLNLAARYGDHLIAVAEKKIYAQGIPQEVMTSENIKHIFHIECSVIQDPIFQCPFFIPHGRHAHTEKN